MVSQAFYRDWSAARRSRQQAKTYDTRSKDVTLTRITKSGSLSKMKDDTRQFHSIEEAADYVRRVHSLNPTRTLRYAVSWPGMEPHELEVK
jgi:hypothetical protein